MAVELPYNDNYLINGETKCTFDKFYSNEKGGVIFIKKYSRCIPLGVHLRNGQRWERRLSIQITVECVVEVDAVQISDRSIVGHSGNGIAICL